MTFLDRLRRAVTATTDGIDRDYALVRRADLGELLRQFERFSHASIFPAFLVDAGSLPLDIGDLMKPGHITRHRGDMPSVPYFSPGQDIYDGVLSMAQTNHSRDCASLPVSYFRPGEIVPLGRDGMAAWYEIDCRRFAMLEKVMAGGRISRLLSGNVRQRWHKWHRLVRKERRRLCGVRWQKMNAWMNSRLKKSS